MKSKKHTIGSCQDELERIARIIVEQKVDENELAFFRKMLKAPLDEIGRIRTLKTQIAENKRIAKIKADQERVYGGRLPCKKQ